MFDSQIMKKSVLARILWFLFLFLGTVMAEVSETPFEVEIHLGSDLLGLRASFVDLLDRGLSSSSEINDSSYMKRLEKDLRGAFSERGGYDLSGRVDSISWGWVDSAARSFLLILKGDFEKKGIRAALLASGWVAQGNDLFELEELSLLLNPGNLLVYSNLSRESALKAAGWFAVPRGWFDLRVSQDLVMELGRRDPRLAPLAQNLRALSVHCSNTECELFGGLSPHTIGLVSGGLQSLRTWLITTLRDASTPNSKSALLDFWQFARGPLMTGSVLYVLEQIEIESKPDGVLCRLMNPGPPQKLLLETMPRFLLGAGVHLTTALVQNRQKIQSFAKAIQSGGGNVFPVGSMGVGRADGDGPCPNSLRLARRAVDFYRSDYGGQEPFETIKGELFEKSYLPMDLECSGKMVKDHQVFETDMSGILQMRNPGSSPGFQAPKK